eukprot:GFUD01027201.1.p1 GENE.GFUD01027201.1~~GFUD01027201.1.p1  ORF type:complete len:1771 (+),score=422.39 GFUD01027201.1:149-5461(+)
MSFKGKTYAKKGSVGSKSGNPFDRMMKEQCNKPVAAKSAGIVGKWGATSFTSLRGNGDNQNPGVPKVKKFFKSRTDTTDSSVENTSDQTNESSPIVTVASAKIINVPEKPKLPPQKKFFRARNREIAPPSETPDEPVPPAPQARARPSRPAQRSSDMSRSPIQRSPTHRSSVERSPIHISPPTSLPPTSPMQAPKIDMKPLPVPQVRRSRQPKVPAFKENPMDKASRLLALIDSQSKENKPSEPPQSDKPVKVQKPAKVASQESQKPVPGPPKVSLPPKFPNFLPKISGNQENKDHLENTPVNDIRTEIVDKRKKNIENTVKHVQESKPPKKEAVKPVHLTRPAQKRKVEETESALPPIKLKLSLNKSPFVGDQYSVVNRPDYDDSMSESSVGSEQPSTVHDSDTASDKTDMSNGFGSTRGYNHSSGYSASASDTESILSKRTQGKAKLKAKAASKFEPSIVEQSDLELLDGDFVVDYSETESIENILEMIPGPRTRSSSPAPGTGTRSPSPVVNPPPKKMFRRASPAVEIVAPVTKKPGRKPGAAKETSDSGQEEFIPEFSEPIPMKPLPTLTKKPNKKQGPIKEVFETAETVVHVKKGRKAAILAEETEEIKPKRGARRQSPVVTEKVEELIFSCQQIDALSGDDTEPELVGSDAEYMPTKPGRKKSPDLQPSDQGPLKKGQRKQPSKAKKEPRKTQKKHAKDLSPQPEMVKEESPPPPVILECITNSEENLNEFDKQFNSIDTNSKEHKLTKNTSKKVTQYHQRAVTPEPEPKEPSPDFEITFSPRRVITPPAMELKKNKKSNEPGSLQRSPSPMASYEDDMTLQDDPPTRPQSPDFEANFPQRITTVETKDAKKPATYKRTNEPLLRAESPDFEMNFPTRKESVLSKEAKKPATYKKSIFRSRAKPVVEEPTPPAATSSPRSPVPYEPPRVPPISLPHVNPTPPDSTSLSDFDSMELDFPARKLEAKPKKQFFKSRNKSPCDSSSSLDLSQSLKQQTVKISLNPKPVAQPPRVPPLTSDYESSQYTPPLRSPSPDFNIEYPTRIAAPAKEVVPAVKPMKRSIFKSKAKANQENTAPPKKALSLYKHKMGWGGDKDELQRLEKIKEIQKAAAAAAAAPSIDSYDDSEFDSEPVASESDLSFAPGKLTRVATYPTNNTGLDDNGDLVTQVKCPKSYKEYFTVIKNVKKAHEMNDLGEYQEFNDDVEYISDGMKPKNSTAARCLAAISLAVKCMKPNFRMHLRAHGEVSKFFVELKDAPSNPSLALCTSTILFVLSQDRLNMDMDRDSLELMLNLLDTDCNIKDALDRSGLDKREMAKNKQKVIDICTEMQSKGHAGTLNLDMISADHLAMETLLSMTSKRAGEWFKEELRELGGLGHLARTLTDCVSYITVREIKVWTEVLTEKLKKANRILRVLENVSHENEENCGYLVEYGRTQEGQEEELLDVLQKLFKLLDVEVQLNPTTDYADKETIGVILRDTLFSVIRVHINLVHDYRSKAYGSLYIGQKQGCMSRVLRILFIMPYWFCPIGKRFEALVLALTLLINMVEHCDENRQSLMDSMAAQKDSDFCVKEEPRMAVEDLVQLFIDRDSLAKMSEEKTDNILDCVDEEVQEIDPREDASKKNDKPTLDETVQKLIGKAGNHMESTLIAAYVGLVMGYLIWNSEDYEQRIREYLPNRDFKEVVAVLHKLHNFMKMTSIGTVASSKGLKATEKIIKHLEKIDAEPESEEEREDTVDFSLFDVSKDDTTLIDNSQCYASTSYSMDDWGKF